MPFFSINLVFWVYKNGFSSLNVQKNTLYFTYLTLLLNFSSQSVSNTLQFVLMNSFWKKKAVGQPNWVCLGKVTPLTGKFQHTTKATQPGLVPFLCVVRNNLKVIAKKLAIAS